MTLGTDTNNLSKYNTIFCDSLQALEWAYKNGLPESAIIKTSAPAMLWDKKNNVQNIESKWTINELEKFQNTIQKMTENIFDLAMNVVGVERELALVVSQSVYKFQSVIYKAACLEECDFTDPRLFISIDGKAGPTGNIMNSPWDKLLQSNASFSIINYTLQNDEWNILTTQGVSYWRRLKIAGIETIIYRLSIKLMRLLPSWMFTKELFIPNENELNIEIASYLALHGVRITNISPEFSSNIKDTMFDEDIAKIYETIFPVVRKRVEQWVVPSAIGATMTLFKSYLEEQLKQFAVLVPSWEKVITKSCAMNRVVLANSPSNLKGFALAYACKKNNILLMSSQHGVTVEISKAHANNMSNVILDNSVADVMFAYNAKIVDIEKKTFFNKSKHYNVGMPLRLVRMLHKRAIDKPVLPMIYISTNLYHAGLSISPKVDYIRALDEHKLVNNVLSMIPYNVCYKTYPDINRRYADTDPVLEDIKNADNINLFSDKIDMRYLVYKYRIFITTCATSTLGWPVMSGNPVVFINRKYNNPLTDDALESLSRGLFVFNDNESGFHDNLRNFLSQPLEEIERLWKEKEAARREMIREYFSSHKSGAGKRSAKIIIDQYLQ